MKIMLFGSNGQVGWELQRALSSLGELKAFDRNDVDLGDADGLCRAVREFRPTVIVNAAAYTAVDQAEEEPEKARQINAVAVKQLAIEAKRANAWLIHYSTDYIFDGTKSGAYEESDTANPLSVYGSSKHQGEQAILQSGCLCLIFRTSWVYASRGSNFLKTMIRLAKERDELKIVADQVGAPTSAELIADITALCLYRLSIDPQYLEENTGVYHLAASGETSWYDFAKLVIAEAINHGENIRVIPDNIHPIATSDYPLPAQRPANSRLSTQKISRVFGVTLPEWQLQVSRAVAESTQGA